MYLRIEDWSLPFVIGMLEARGLPHGEHVLKVFASEVDPRFNQLFNRKNITIFEINDEPFQEDETFDYLGRETYTGSQLNDRMQELGLSHEAARRVRALFRFANLPETGLTQQAMQLKNQEGNWLIDHPFGDIDGITKALQNPELHSENVHLDIFVPESLDKIASLLGATSLTEAEGILTYEEARAFKFRTKEGGHSRGKEQ